MPPARCEPEGRQQPALPSEGSPFPEGMHRFEFVTLDEVRSGERPHLPRSRGAPPSSAVAVAAWQSSTIDVPTLGAP